MAFPIITECLARIEHKIDALLKAFEISVTPMHFLGQVCPACKMPVSYDVDIKNRVIVRKCECGTKKIVPDVSLTEDMNQPGNKNVKQIESSTDGGSVEPRTGDKPATNSKRR